jgi:hypothetical protein
VETPIPSNLKAAQVGSWVEGALHADPSLDLYWTVATLPPPQSNTEYRFWVVPQTPPLAAHEQELGQDRVSLMPVYINVRFG